MLVQGVEELREGSSDQLYPGRRPWPLEKVSRRATMRVSPYKDILETKKKATKNECSERGISKTRSPVKSHVSLRKLGSGGVFGRIPRSTVETSYEADAITTTLAPTQGTQRIANVLGLCKRTDRTRIQVEPSKRSCLEKRKLSEERGLLVASLLGRIPGAMKRLSGKLQCLIG